MGRIYFVSQYPASGFDTFKGTRVIEGVVMGKFGEMRTHLCLSVPHVNMHFPPQKTCHVSIGIMSVYCGFPLIYIGTSRY